MRLWVIRIEPTLNALVIAGSAFRACPGNATGPPMRPLGTLAFVLAAVLLLAPGWSGEQRLMLPEPPARIVATPVPLDPSAPGRRRVGALTFLNGVELTSPDPAFGGFSALLVRGDAFTLLNDGGNVARFRLGADDRVREPNFVPLPAGPGTGWTKLERDGEALAINPRNGRVWIAFERANAIWRYAPDLARAERAVRPAAMRRWRRNGGAEAMTRLADGRFLAIAEERTRGEGREALLFAGDPTDGRAPLRFRYVPPDGFDPCDVAQLPDGRVLVLNRWYGLGLPLRFRSVLTVLNPASMRPGALVRGREVARLAPPLQTENFEGVAVTEQAGQPTIWLLSDNDMGRRRRTLLLQFRLN
jgi:hypothetical protein